MPLFSIAGVCKHRDSRCSKANSQWFLTSLRTPATQFCWCKLYSAIVGPHQYVCLHMSGTKCGRNSGAAQETPRNVKYKGGRTTRHCTFVTAPGGPTIWFPAMNFWLKDPCLSFCCRGCSISCNLNRRWPPLLPCNTWNETSAPLLKVKCLGFGATMTSALKSAVINSHLVALNNWLIPGERFCIYSNNLDPKLALKLFFTIRKEAK